jgi:hypothetical protein
VKMNEASDEIEEKISAFMKLKMGKVKLKVNTSTRNLWFP